MKKTDILAALERFDKDQQSEINFDIFYQASPNTMQQHQSTGACHILHACRRHVSLLCAACALTAWCVKRQPSKRLVHGSKHNPMHSYTFIANPLQVLLSFYQGRTFDDMVERAWQIFDSSNKGHITYSSLRSVVKEARQQIDDDELHDMIQCFDSDQDGQISKADFRKILRVYDPDHDPLDDDD